MIFQKTSPDLKSGAILNPLKIFMHLVIFTHRLYHSKSKASSQRDALKFGGTDGI